MGDKLRVAFFVVSNWKEGATGVRSFIRGLVPFLQEQFDCVLIQPATTSKIVEQDTTDAKRVARPTPNWYRLLLGYVLAILRQCRVLRKQRSELRHRVFLMNSFGCVVWPIAARLAFPFARIVTIAHTHPGQDRKAFHSVRQLTEKLCALSVSEVIFNSYALKSMWEEKLGRPIHKSVVVHHGMDIPDKCEVPPAYPEKEVGVVDVVCGGLFYRWKGQLALIDAWPHILEQCNKVPMRLIFVGEGAVYQEAREKVVDLGLEASVLFLGQQENGADFFNGADIAIHYPIEPEAFGLVLLEAMARGKPVIAPAHGGATEIVVHGETGFLVPPAVGGEIRENSHKEHRETQRSLKSSQLR